MVQFGLLWSIVDTNPMLFLEVHTLYIITLTCCFCLSCLESNLHGHILKSVNANVLSQDEHL